MNSSRPPGSGEPLAPGASTQSAYAPGRDEKLPAVDERLVMPEAHVQALDGRIIRTMGANPPHAFEHFQVTKVFAGCLAPGYVGAVDMLTRLDVDSDAAPDVSILAEGPDPTTGGRRVEEIAFEVLDSETLSHATRKVEKLIARGVRRAFCVRVAERVVYEWSREHGDWEALEAGSAISDVCFRVPFVVEALVDCSLADDAIAEALLTARNRVIEKALALREEKGEAQGLHERRTEGRVGGVCLVFELKLGRELDERERVRPFGRVSTRWG